MYPARFQNLCTAPDKRYVFHRKHRSNIPKEGRSQPVRDTEVVQSLGLPLRETLQQRWHCGRRADFGLVGEQVHGLHRCQPYL